MSQETFRPHPSPGLLRFEVLLHLVVAAILMAELEGWILALALILLLLLGTRFFRNQSTLAGFPSGCSLLIDTRRQAITWRQQGREIICPVENTRLILTRWFVFLQMNEGRSRLNKLILADSFEDINRYTLLRRQIKDIYRC